MVPNQENLYGLMYTRVRFSYDLSISVQVLLTFTMNKLYFKWFLNLFYNSDKYKILVFMNQVL